MPLVSLKEVLDWAEAHNAAVPAFNIDNIDIAQSLMLAAEEEQKPVILAGRGPSGSAGWIFWPPL